MYTQNVIIHKIVPGDNLYRLAKQYNTTVDGILVANPYLDPRNLKIGDQIFIYPGHDGLYDESLTMAEVNLMNTMRQLLLDHVIWLRLLMISILEDLNDVDFNKKRFLRNAIDIANVFRVYYGDDVADTISALLTEHAAIGEKLIRSLKEGDINNFNNLDKAWHKNADEIAFALASINPYYIEQDIREMLYNHLYLEKKQLTDRLNGNYAADINDFDKTQQQILVLADYLTDGLINQFKNKFI